MAGRSPLEGASPKKSTSFADFAANVPKGAHSSFAATPGKNAQISRIEEQLDSSCLEACAAAGVTCGMSTKVDATKRTLRAVDHRDLEKIRRTTIRRNAPQGEDIRGIERVLKSVQGRDITLQEFIGLVAPYTRDNGAAMRAVMNEDLASFRKLAEKVFETVTQDTSDVFMNQQLEVQEYYKDRKTMFTNKMLAAISDIFDLAPKFDFDCYQKDKEAFLELIMPLPAVNEMETSEMQMQKRQQAYHRLQWLRSEGIRLSEENDSLSKRLKDLKRLQRAEQRQAEERERLLERERERLEAKEEERRERLEELSNHLEKSIIGKETSMRMDADADVSQPKPPPVPPPKKKRPNRTEWKQTAARRLEETHLGEYEDFERSRIADSSFSE